MYQTNQNTFFCAGFFADVVGNVLTQRVRDKYTGFSMIELPGRCDHQIDFQNDQLYKKELRRTLKEMGIRYHTINKTIKRAMRVKKSSERCLILGFIIKTHILPQNFTCIHVENFETGFAKYFFRIYKASAYFEGGLVPIVDLRKFEGRNLQISNVDDPWCIRQLDGLFENNEVIRGFRNTHATALKKASANMPARFSWEDLRIKRLKETHYRF